MGAIARDEVKGYAFEDGIFCLECVGADEAARALETDTITPEDAEENGEVYFCDTCHKRIA